MTALDTVDNTGDICDAGERELLLALEEDVNARFDAFVLPGAGGQAPTPAILDSAGLVDDLRRGGPLGARASMALMAFLVASTDAKAAEAMIHSPVAAAALAAAILPMPSPAVPPGSTWAEVSESIKRSVVAVAMPVVALVGCFAQAGAAAADTLRQSLRAGFAAGGGEVSASACRDTLLSYGDRPGPKPLSFLPPASVPCTAEAVDAYVAFTRAILLLFLHVQLTAEARDEPLLTAVAGLLSEYDPTAFSASGCAQILLGAAGAATRLPVDVQAALTAYLPRVLSHPLETHVRKAFALFALQRTTAAGDNAASSPVLMDASVRTGAVGPMLSGHAWTRDALESLFVDVALRGGSRGDGSAPAAALCDLVALLEDPPGTEASPSTPSSLTPLAQSARSSLVTTTPGALSPVTPLEAAPLATHDSSQAATAEPPPPPPPPSPGRARYDLVTAVFAAVSSKADLPAVAAVAAAEALLSLLDRALGGSASAAAAQAVSDLGRRKTLRPSIVARLVGMLEPSLRTWDDDSSGVGRQRAAGSAFALFHLAGRPGTKADMGDALPSLLSLMTIGGRQDSDSAASERPLSPMDVRRCSNQGGASDRHEAKAVAAAVGALMRLATHPAHRDWLRSRGAPAALVPLVTRTGPHGDGGLLKSAAALAKFLGGAAPSRRGSVDVTGAFGGLTLQPACVEPSM